MDAAAIPGEGSSALLLFQKRFHAGLVSGAVTLTFRRWKKPHVKPGGRYRCHPIGVLEVDSVVSVRVGDITVADAVSSGFPTLEALLEYMAQASEEPLAAEAEVFRIALRHGGDGDRVTVALETALTLEDVAEITKALAKMDAKGKPWTKKTLAIIDAEPRVAASKLAVKLRRETLELKEDIRKLKRLGLTQSFEVGYEISPRGRAYLEAVTKAPRAKRAVPKKVSPRTTKARAR